MLDGFRDEAASIEEIALMNRGVELGKAGAE
jgi:hypothetical protein